MTIFDLIELISKSLNEPQDVKRTLPSFNRKYYNNYIPNQNLLINEQERQKKYQEFNKSQQVYQGKPCNTGYCN